MKNKIKILLIHTRNIFEQDGASANRWRSLVEGISNLGIEVVILFTQGYGSVEELKKYGSKGKIGNISYRYTMFFLHSSLWMKRISGYLLTPSFRKINAAIVKKEYKKYGPQIVWLLPSIDVLDIYMTAFGKSRIINHKLMIELNEYNDMGEFHAGNKLQLFKAKKYSRVLLSEILPRMDFLLIMTRHLLEYYRQFTNSEKAIFLHLPMTVDLSRFQIEKKSLNRYIAYCGSSSFIKDGVDILIKSFAMLANKYPDVDLKIAAFMESEGVNMLALIKELNLSDRIEYVGELKRDEIPSFITNAEILVLPRPDSKQARGGFPTKLGEYLATGNPVCATMVGEIPDYLKDNESVFFAEPGSVDSFVNAMERALSDKPNATKVGEQGKRVAELNFNMHIQSRRLTTFIAGNI